ncbi:MAG TPA: carboxypeptidase regulatory-like domain-containing protein [Terriglobia bacterium]|nr:carboxypeptidase regulatory-like domain-containing protein [Terriglobia bacterium]
MKHGWRVSVVRSFEVLCLALTLNLVAGLFSVAGAQTSSATLSGTVMDSQGAVVPDVAITVSSTATGLKRQAATNSEGLFTVPLLPPGIYSLHAEREGFSVVEIEGIELPVAGQISRNIILQVGGIRETVNVSAAPPLLQTDTSALADVVNNRQVDLLPINGRDFRRLTTLLPGAAPRSQRGSLGSFTINGQREKANIFLIDGVDNNDSFRNQSSFNQGGVTGAPATLLPVDAIGEFSLQTQGSAEYGRNSGAIVNIVLKSGTNDFHGAAYDFLRNDNFDARNFFERAKNEFRNNNFGGVLGGPIIKNRTFFFGGYEGQREFVFSPSVVRVPDAANLSAARTANAAAGLQENALSTGLLQFFPQPNLNVTTGNNYSFAAPNTNNSDNVLAKIEHRFNDKYSLSGRYIFGDGNQVFPLTTGNGSPLPAYQTVVPTRIQLFGLSLSQILTSQVVNETRVGYNRFVQTFTALDADFDPASIGLVTGAKSLPTITITGFVPLGAPTNVPRGRVSSGYQFVDNLTWARQSHVFKTGGEYRRAIVNSFNDQLARGRLNFDSLADFLAGRVAPAGTAVLRGATRRDTFTNNFGLFIQDDWKITTRLTLNLGLRYEYLGVFREQGDRLSNFLPTRGLVRVGEAGLDHLYEPDYNNFAPRFGFAYDLAGRGRTILRGGYGLYYDTPSQDYFLLQGFQNAGPGSPALNPLPGLGVFNLTFPAGAAIPYGLNVPIFGAATGSLPTSNIPVFGVDPDLRTPYVHNYNLNLQHELRPGTVLQASYVGSRGVKLYRVRDVNQATAGPAASRQQRRPFNAQFPEFSFINYLETSANSSYNALQTTIKQRLARGFNLFGTYTWSKSLDDASNGIYSGTRGVAYPQDGYDLRAERAVSSFDLRHRVTLNVTYELNFLPGLLGSWPKRLAEGWQLSGIYTGQSGLPITPFLSIDSSGTGELNDRPDLVGDPNSGPQRPNEWFNKAAFARPAPGTFGNSGRNVILGPDLHSVDLSVNKLTKVAERASLQFRAEVFNVFNRANFSLPNVDFNGTTFGAISETPDVTAGNPRLGEGGPRVVQFGLKFIF